MGRVAYLPFVCLMLFGLMLGCGDDEPTKAPERMVVGYWRGDVGSGFVYLAFLSDGVACYNLSLSVPGGCLSGTYNCSGGECSAQWGATTYNIINIQENSLCLEDKTGGVGACLSRVPPDAFPCDCPPVLEPLDVLATYNVSLGDYCEVPGVRFVDLGVTASTRVDGARIFSDTVITPDDVGDKLVADASRDPNFEEFASVANRAQWLNLELQGTHDPPCRYNARGLDPSRLWGDVVKRASIIILGLGFEDEGDRTNITSNLEIIFEGRKGAE